MKKNSDTMRKGVGRRSVLPMGLITCLASVLIALVLEGLFRQSIGKAFEFVISKPLVFLFNAAIIAFTLNIAAIFKKRLFYITLISVLWLIIGAVNLILLTERTGLPFTYTDIIFALKEPPLISVYYSTAQIIAGISAIVLIIAGLVVLYLKSPVYRKELKKGIIRLICSVIILALLTVLLIGMGSLSDTLRPDVYGAYSEYGFTYGFVYSFFDRGISEPEEYSLYTITDITDDIDIEIEVTSTPVASEKHQSFTEFIRNGVLGNEPEDYTKEAIEAIKELLPGEEAASGSLPNIIFVQLESFFDPTLLTEYEFDENPIPNFTALKSEYSCGYLDVPTVAGGTANTEFEVLTGCNLDLFGAGEFPFYTILNESVFESLAADLKAVGYVSTLVHDYTGTFYHRNNVYSNLYFDRFVSMEHIAGLEFNINGWAKDKCLTGVIMDALKTSEEKDFIFTISVQTHGAYEGLEEGTSCPISVTKAPDDGSKSAMEYYVYQLYEVDEFIGELTQAVSEFNEDTVIVFYGDHLPGLGFTADEISTGCMFKTEYVVWANYDLPKSDADTEAYRLGADVLKMLGISSGTMIRLHQTLSGQPKYQKALELIEYDITYGEGYIYGGARLTRSDEMSYGLYPILITDVKAAGSSIIVSGEGFTEASVVFLNESELETTFISCSMLAADAVYEAESAVCVKQLALTGDSLGESNTFILP